MKTEKNVHHIGMLLITILMVCFHAYSVYASVDVEIVFQDYSWGDDAKSIAESLGENYFDSLTPGWSDADTNMPSSYYTLGYRIYTINDREIAGYKVSNFNMYFLYGHDEDGKISTDAALSELYLVNMDFEVSDIEGTYDDLLSKLTSIFGEGHTSSYIDTTYSTDGIYDVRKEKTEWQGENRTGILLTKSVPEEDAPEGAVKLMDTYVSLSYGKTDSDQVIEERYKEFEEYTIEREREKRDSSDISGLWSGDDLPGLDAAKSTLVSVDDYLLDDRSEGTFDYYYDNLPEMYKEAYREIYAKLSSGEDSGNLIVEVTTDDFWTAYYSVLADHPELFWVGSSAEIQSDRNSGIVKSYSIEAVVPVDERETVAKQMKEEVDTFLNSIDTGLTDYEKIKSVYDYIIKTTRYDSNAEDNQCMQSVILNHASVGAGYSKAFQYILGKMGINCIYATGANNEGAGIAWNMVQIGEQYYHVDTTWGDPDSNTVDTEGITTPDYYFLCCTDDDIYRTRMVEMDVVSPKCVDDSYDYFKMNNLFFDVFDYDEVYNALINSVQNEEESVQMKFGSEEEYNKARDEIFGKQMYYDADQVLMQKNGVDTWNNKYATDDERYTITIQWM